MLSSALETFRFALDGNGPLFKKDGTRFGNGGELHRAYFLLTDSTVGTEQNFNADGHVVLPQKQHVLTEILIFLALEKIRKKTLLLKYFLKKKVKSIESI